MTEPARPEFISGYDPPASPKKSGRYSVYKTFTPDLPKKKNEKFNNTVVGGLYQYSSNGVTTEKEQCILCESEIVYECPCAFSCKRCVNNHISYMTRDGKRTVGDPHSKK